MKSILLGFLVVFLCIQTVSAITCDAAPAATTIDLGLSKKVTISCSDWGDVTSVTVDATQYNADCLSLDKTSDTITSGVTKDFTITATSMACQANVDDRTIIWKFTPSTGTAPASKSTTVTIQSGLTITATFKNAPYSATVGDSVNIILEVSTTANEDITGINIDMSQSSSALISAGVTDKSISKISASTGEKTQQVSWTITAPSAGSYNLKAVVTSTNADSDTATTTLTTTAAEEEGAPPAGPGVGAPPEKLKNATRPITLVPGIGLRNNTKLQDALAKVLKIAKLSEQAIENLITLSASIYADVEVGREFKAAEGKSTLSMTVKYKGAKKAKNFIVWDKIPKTFANSSDLINVTAPGATIEVVEADPEYAFVYSEVSPDQELTITYETSGEKDASLINETETEVYAESLEEVVAPPAAICTPGAKQCVGDDLQQCSVDGTAWETIETCEYGCDPATLACKEKPVVIPPVVVSYLWVWITIIIIIVALILVGVYWKKYKKF